jgi:hypothetical protein
MKESAKEKFHSMQSPKIYLTTQIVSELLGGSIKSL